MWPTITVLAIIFFAIAGIMFLRKLQYDQMHMNLLSMVEKYGGEVMRRGFAASPVYSGKFKNGMLVINFSSVREDKGKREFYVTYSYETTISSHFSIMSLEWLKNHPVEQNPEAKNIEIGRYRVSSNQAATIKLFKNKSQIMDGLQTMENLVYFFSSARGVMFEIQIDNLLTGSEISTIDEALQIVHRFILKAKKG